MELEIFTLCDYAQDYQGKLAILGTFDRIMSRQFPAVHPQCTVAVRMRFSKNEAGPYYFKIAMIDEKGRDFIPPVMGEIQVKIPQDVDHSCVNIVVNYAQLKFENTGKYSFVLYLNDEWKTGLPLTLARV